MRMGRFFLIFAIIFTLFGCTQVVQLNKAGEALSAVRPDGNLHVLFLDVGQGGSQLLISPSGKTMLIDAGNNDKEQLMLDYLEQYGIEKLDIVIGTHPDADHTGGLDKVIDRTNIGQIYMPRASSNTKTFESLLLSIKNKGLKVFTAKAGLTLDWDDKVSVEMVGPVQQYEDSNNMSAVVKVTFGNTSFLLTGDAESEAEKDMLEAGVNLSSTVLGVGHHGSRSSTTLRFLQAVKPKYAVIQSGADNRYGHPHQTILARLQKESVNVYRNDLQGTIVFRTNGMNMHISTER